ncbi:MAG: 6-pyruvoyl trahydropterin synthase family protein [Micromonosporaceae bacterium]
MYRIGKRFGFEAAHHLTGLPEGHKCARPHGHSYTVEVSVAADVVTPPGFVADFADLAPLSTHLAETFDHRDLNMVLDVPPTSENLARLLYEWCAENLALPAGVSLAAVRVSETGSTFAEYTPAGS